MPVPATASVPAHDNDGRPRSDGQRGRPAASAPSRDSRDDACASPRAASPRKPRKQQLNSTPHQRQQLVIRKMMEAYQKQLRESQTRTTSYVNFQPRFPPPQPQPDIIGGRKLGKEDYRSMDLKKLYGRTDLDDAAEVPSPRWDVLEQNDRRSESDREPQRLRHGSPVQQTRAYGGRPVPGGAHRARNAPQHHRRK